MIHQAPTASGSLLYLFRYSIGDNPVVLLKIERFSFDLLSSFGSLNCYLNKVKILSVRQSIRDMETVEVFKTNVSDRNQATRLIEKINVTFVDYQANFDLDDCDKILRVKCKSREVNASHIINLLNDLGYAAEVLSDDFQHAV